MLGFGMAAVVMDTMSGQLRLTFGPIELMQGIDFLVVVIGLFGLGEILVTMEEGLQFQGKSARIDPRIIFRTWARLPRYWMTLARSALIGCWLGITPGGATAASFMGYGLAKKFSREPDKFGTGQMEGVLAPETAAHASVHERAAADARAGHSEVRNRGGAAWRTHDLGPGVRSTAVRGTERFRMGG